MLAIGGALSVMLLMTRILRIVCSGDLAGAGQGAGEGRLRPVLTGRSPTDAELARCTRRWSPTVKSPTQATTAELPVQEVRGRDDRCGFDVG